MSTFTKGEVDAITEKFVAQWKTTAGAGDHKTRLINQLRSEGVVEKIQKQMEKHVQNSSLPLRYNVTSLIERRRLFEELRREIQKEVDFKKVQRQIEDICYAHDGCYYDSLKANVAELLPSVIETVKLETESKKESLTTKSQDVRSASGKLPGDDVQSILDELLLNVPSKK